MNDNPELGEPDAPPAFSEPVTPAAFSESLTPTALSEPVGSVGFADHATLPPIPEPPGPTSRSRRTRTQPYRGNGKGATGQRVTAGQPRPGRPKSPPLRRPFRGPRLTDQIGFWRRLRSIIELIAVSVILGILLAAIVAAVVGGIVVAIQNALNA